MKETVLSRFYDSEKYLICPKCASPLKLKERSLVCANGHCYDIAKQGYVNLIPGAKKSESYDRESFKDRRIILEAGYYDHILFGINERIFGDTVVDAGCGEGYYSKNISAKKLFAFDISKDSVALAAKGDNKVCWFTADLAAIPLRDSFADTVLNIFTPANYSEFKRVLKKDGRLVKAVPGKDHLKELRYVLKDELSSYEYSNDRIIEHCRKNFDIIDITEFTKTYDITDEHKRALTSMTPLMFGVTKEKDFSGLTEITISAVLITAVLKQ
ncbi:MAG: methyltransferase domain-containing protein [Christensenellaceae bacterium]|nr:methyltransferase domain-containing protein [Christensenellaceae bacterium]